MMSSKMPTLFEKMIVSGYTLVTTFHALGFFLLYKTKGELPNQRIITMNLALVEMLYCLSQISFIVFDWTNAHFFIRGIIYGQVFLEVFIFCTIRLIILHLIIDRFLDVWLNLKYPVYINKKSLLITIAVLWFIGISLGLTLALYAHLDIKKLANCFRIIKVLHLALDITIIVTSLATHIYFFTKVKRITQGTSNQRRRRSSSSINIWFKLKIPSLMVLTFIFFNTTSTILKYIDYMYLASAKIKMTFNILDLCGWCSDAFIYILMQRRVRRLLFSMFRGVERNQTTDISVPRNP